MPDLAKILEEFLKTTDAHQITNLFLGIIVVTFLISLFFALFGIGRKFTRYTSALLTSLGILGTFIGIVIGLLDFNPQDIDGSIELLLNGLKTAFITSLAGMGMAIIFQLIATTPIFRENRVKDEIVDVEPKDILNAITNQGKHFERLVTAISGGDDSSLTGQIKLLRSDVNDNHKVQQKRFKKFSTELWANLKEFSEMLSKSATEQVVQALKDVIVDFNENLTEQFGENFKALDASVKKLVDWQDNYRVQLEEMDRQYSQSVQAITEIEKSVLSINTESKEIPITMNSLKTVLETNQHQIQELANHLEAFKDVKEQAVQAFPEIQKHIDKTIEDIALTSKKVSDSYQLLLDKTDGTQSTFTKSIEKVQKQLETSVSELVEKQVSEMNKSFNAMEDGHQLLLDKTESTHNVFAQNIEKVQKQLESSVTELGNKQASEMKKAFNTMEDGHQLLLNKTEGTQEIFTKSIEKVQKQLETTVSELVEKQVYEMNKSFNAMEDEVSKTVQLTGDAVNKQLEMMDESMTQEVNRVMTEMGKSLAQISRRFTTDYKELVNAMRNITGSRN